MPFNLKYCLYIQYIIFPIEELNVMTPSLNDLKQRRLIWQARQQHPRQSTCIASGYSQLDEHLGGGWPASGVVELQPARLGIGELRLLFPCLETLASQPGLQAWVNPPARLSPYPLHTRRLPKTIMLNTSNQNEHLWVSEQLLKSDCCRVVICWTAHLQPAAAKRLQLAAKEGNCLAFVIHYPVQQEHSLPLSARLRLAPHAKGLNIELFKRQQAWPLPPFDLDLRAQWPQLFHPQPRSHAARTLPDNVVAFPESHSARNRL